MDILLVRGKIKKYIIINTGKKQVELFWIFLSLINMSFWKKYNFFENNSTYSYISASASASASASTYNN